MNKLSAAPYNGDITKFRPSLLSDVIWFFISSIKPNDEKYLSKPSVFIQKDKK